MTFELPSFSDSKDMTGGQSGHVTLTMPIRG